MTTWRFRKFLSAAIALAALGAVSCSQAAPQDEAGATPAPASDADGDAATADDDGGASETENSFADAIDGLDAAEGLFTVYSDPDGARVLLELPAPDPETRTSARAIYVAYLRSGLGSNPVGLDRGLNGGPSVLRLEVRGGRVFFVAENTRFIASSDNQAEARAVEESFARSIIWAGDIEATHEDGRVLVDISSFLTRDAIGVAEAMSSAEQGSFSLDADRSAVDAAATLAFPDNVELEAFVTFSSSDPGAEVRATAANAQSPTFTLHHSFVRLPDDGFAQRAFDPRIGVIAYPIADYAVGLDEQLETPTILRFRLERTDPEAESSPAVEPIIFYVDPGAPEPVRQALIEGASWWEEAFEAAGFEDGYRVEVLPEGAHPLDARYNVINWVHRQTRGWSYGSPIYDPRTGEIIRAVITLGSLRVRQDRRIFEGLLDASRTGTGAPDDPVVLSLARLRQLSAHEVGHGLGFPHNMAASANDRASVMDYPAPLVTLDAEGDIDVSQAYGVGVGPWDIASARYLYTQFPDGADEAAELDAIIAQTRADGLYFVTDPDSRPIGGANSTGSLWDNGSDPVDALNEALDVRAAALSDFGPANLPEGRPVSELREVLTPIHLWHRYAINAAGKLVGGYRFAYAVNGDADFAVRPVAPSRQRAALAALLRAADAQTLTLPANVVDAMAPVHASWFDAGSREVMAGHTGAIFDERAAAAIGAGLVFDSLLDPARAERLATVSAPGALSLEEMLTTTSQRVTEGLDLSDPREARNGFAIAERFVTELIQLASSDRVSSDTAARVEAHMAEFAASLDSTSSGPSDERAMLARRLNRFLERPAAPASAAEPPPSPPGSPIGGHAMEPSDDWHAPLTSE